MLPLIKDDVQEIVLFFIGTERPTTYTLPYTTLFRSRAHSPGCEVGGELQPLAIVFSPRRCRELSRLDRKSTRLNSSHVETSYAVFCLKKKTFPRHRPERIHTVPYGSPSFPIHRRGGP